jgi:hypothetical protein
MSETDTDAPQGRVHLIFALSALLVFIIGIMYPDKGYLLFSGPYVVVGLARYMSDRFDQWARQRNLLDRMTIILLTVLFMYSTWAGPVPDWLP